MKIILATVMSVTLSAFLLVFAPPMRAERWAWERAHPKNYTFEYQYTCFCPGSGAWWRISVRDETFLYFQLVDPPKLTDHSPGLEKPPVQLPNMSTIFDKIAARASGSTYYRVRYDPRWHFPVYAHGDNWFWTDSDWTISVRNFHADQNR